ncbi:MAG: hypothetical protein K2R93_06500 [Gemmatimonadaceae bacterium]|nr:hypothetical protein [Gemmatimonadaceae bacterium]
MVILGVPLAAHGQCRTKAGLDLTITAQRADERSYNSRQEGCTIYLPGASEGRRIPIRIEGAGPALDSLQLSPLSPTYALSAIGRTKDSAMEFDLIPAIAVPGMSTALIALGRAPVDTLRVVFSPMPELSILASATPNCAATICVDQSSGTIVLVGDVNVLDAAGDALLDAAPVVVSVRGGAATIPIPKGLPAGEHVLELSLNRKIITTELTNRFRMKFSLATQKAAGSPRMLEFFADEQRASPIIGLREGTGAVAVFTSEAVRLREGRRYLVREMSAQATGVGAVIAAFKVITQAAGGAFVLLEPLRHRGGYASVPTMPPLEVVDADSLAPLQLARLVVTPTPKVTAWTVSGRTDGSSSRSDLVVSADEAITLRLRGDALLDIREVAAEDVPCQWVDPERHTTAQCHIPGYVDKSVQFAAVDAGGRTVGTAVAKVVESSSPEVTWSFMRLTTLDTDSSRRGVARIDVAPDSLLPLERINDLQLEFTGAKIDQNGANGVQYVRVLVTAREPDGTVAKVKSICLAIVPPPRNGRPYSVNEQCPAFSNVVVRIDTLVDKALTYGTKRSSVQIDVAFDPTGYRTSTRGLPGRTYQVSRRGWLSTVPRLALPSAMISVRKGKAIAAAQYAGALFTLSAYSTRKCTIKDYLLGCLGRGELPISLTVGTVLAGQTDPKRENAFRSDLSTVAGLNYFTRSMSGAVAFEFFVGGLFPMAEGRAFFPDASWLVRPGFSVQLGK